MISDIFAWEKLQEQVEELPIRNNPGTSSIVWDGGRKELRVFYSCYETMRIVKIIML